MANIVTEAGTLREIKAVTGKYLWHLQQNFGKQI